MPICIPFCIPDCQLHGYPHEIAFWLNKDNHIKEGIMNKENRFINYLNHIVFGLMMLGLYMSPVEVQHLLDFPNT